MKKFLFAILALSLTACLSPSGDQPASQVTVTSEATVTLPLSTALPAPTATATEIPFTELPPEEQAAQYLAGKVQDVSVLNFEQRKAFSIALAEKREAERKDKSITYNGEAYIHPETFDMVSLNDGSTAKEREIQMYYPAARDDDGYLHIYVDGEWIKINNSKDVKFEISDDPHNPDITWPTTEKLGADRGELAGLTVPQAGLARKEESTVMVPFLVLKVNEAPGEIMIRGYGRKQGTLPGLIIESDGHGNPVLARQTIVSGIGRLYWEGKNTTAGGTGNLDSRSELWQKLGDNTLYYLFAYADQSGSFDSVYVQGSGEVTMDYTGLAPSSKSLKVIIGDQKDKYMTWLNGLFLMEADNH